MLLAQGSLYLRMDDDGKTSALLSLSPLFSILDRYDSVGGDGEGREQGNHITYPRPHPRFPPVLTYPHLFYLLSLFNLSLQDHHL